MPNSLSPGISGYEGRPPVAIQIVAAVTVTYFLPSSRRIVWESMKDAYALKYFNLSFMKSDLYPQLSDLMCF